MHEKVFSVGEKFPTAKPKIAIKMSCGENNGDKISSGDIERSKSSMRRNLTRQQFHTAKFSAVKFPVEKFKISVAKFNAAIISRGEIFCGEISGSEKLGERTQILQKH